MIKKFEYIYVMYNQYVLSNNNKYIDIYFKVQQFRIYIVFAKQMYYPSIYTFPLNVKKCFLNSTGTKPFAMAIWLSLYRSEACISHLCNRKK